jgi:hypothetical protein
MFLRHMLASDPEDRGIQIIAPESGCLALASEDLGPRNRASPNQLCPQSGATQRGYREVVCLQIWSGSWPGLKKPLGKPRFTAVTGLTGPDRFRSGPVRYSPNSNLKFEKKNAEKIPKNSP